MDYKILIKKYWQILALALIFIASLNMLLFSSHLEHPTLFDPQFQYRYTEYIVEQGSLPDWDYYSYAPVGRPLDTPPLMHYISAYSFKIFGGLTDWDLGKFLVYMPAIFAALSVIPAYMIGRELSGKVAGILSAIFVGFSPAVVQRSMAGYYDTDGIVVLFSILTLWAFVYAFKRQSNVEDHTSTMKGYAKLFLEKRIWIGYSIATIVTILFALTWQTAWYIPIIIWASTFAYWGFLSLFGKKEWIVQTDKKKIKPDFFQRIKKSFPMFLKVFIPTSLSLAVSIAVVQALGYNPVYNILLLFRFAQDPTAVLIVNQSVAELQKVNIFGNGMAELYARVSIPVVFAIAGTILALRKNLLMGSVLLTWSIVSFASISQGIRFMLVFAPAAAITSAIALSEAFKNVKHSRYGLIISVSMLAAVLVSLMNPLLGMFIGLFAISFILFSKNGEGSDSISKAIMIGAVAIAAILTISHGAQVASSFQSQQAISPEWDEAFEFLREQTAEDSIVGTWWDPGHDIASLGERRNIADGAHCGAHKCTPGMNERITDLGFIFSTDNEDLAKERLLKYKGNSSEVYWIVSDDLIQKFQWLYFFGTGCDARANPECNLYTRLTQQSFSYSNIDYDIVAYNFGNDVRTTKNEGTWIAGVDANGTFTPFSRQVTYVNGQPRAISVESPIDRLIWIEENSSYLVLIPENLENSMFSRMFFYEEDEELKNFDLVFRNSKVKIYKLII